MTVLREELSASAASHGAGAPRAALGVVLCGGQSRRMGRDKARLVLEGETLVSRAIRALDAVSDEVVLATGERPRYPESGRRCVLDSVPDGGPLAGLAGRARSALGSRPAG